MKLRSPFGATVLIFACAILLSNQGDAQDNQGKLVVDDDGTIHVPAQAIPMSVFLSPEAKALSIRHLKGPSAAPPQQGRPPGGGMAARSKILFPVDMEDTKIAGVHAYIYTPKTGVSAANKNRVLINLHGGGFNSCWPGCAEAESIPIASLGQVRVISLDYRQGPEYKFPAASEDVAAVYKELLKDHSPQSIGIFGCSAGGTLTAMSVAWFDKHNIPMPGAVGIFCSGAGSPGGALGAGDSTYMSSPLGGAGMAPPLGTPAKPRTGYLADTDPKDPLVAPINSPSVLAKFPPTLIITATRAPELSAAVYTHSQLVKLGVDAELHVWEGLYHGFYYDPDVPENRDCYNVIVSYFDRHLHR